MFRQPVVNITIQRNMMENCYLSQSASSSGFTESWNRQNLAEKMTSSAADPAVHTSVDSASNINHGDDGCHDRKTPHSNILSANGDYSHSFGTEYNIEPFSNLLPLTSSYKDFTMFKESKGHDVADALLSLKHAVVHPSLGPLSPTPLPQQPLPTMGQHSFSYAMPQNPYQAYGTSAPHGPYRDYASYHAPMGDHGQQTPPESASQPAGSGMFPAMSLNVSMSMNVGMPPAGGPGACPAPGQQAPDPWTQPTSSQYSPGANVHMGTAQPPPGYGGYHSGYSASYNFSTDFRQRESMFKMASPDSYRNIPKMFNQMKRGGRISPCTTPRSSVDLADGVKVNLCRICGKTYARPSTLKTHMRTHSGEKPYRCQTCNKSFSQAANLTAHNRTHNGEKPFRCPMCDRRFSQSSSVTTHMRTHSGERPYRCRLCKKAFSDSSTLTKHLRIHSGEKPYQCKLCLLRFSQSGNLNRHMRVHANSA